MLGIVKLYEAIECVTARCYETSEIVNHATQTSPTLAYISRYGMCALIQIG